MNGEPRMKCKICTVHPLSFLKKTREFLLFFGTNLCSSIQIKQYFAMVWIDMQLTVNILIWILVGSRQDSELLVQGIVEPYLVTLSITINTRVFLNHMWPCCVRNRNACWAAGIPWKKWTLPNFPSDCHVKRCCSICFPIPQASFSFALGHRAVFGLIYWWWYACNFEVLQCENENNMN